ncbi:splicing regulator ARVCF-like isoform X3 [Biomphalaria glabrata]|uniref:Splicing regulator ARVCF-like isoform X3 n=1 Tax=Biomphalaria glabrata TaxID=6526 RepID=A0A9W3BHR9_BIOGL|nr:splicing regulator ARVCF-like isoform X3 [Biomphalaria glabrata]
MSSSLVRHEDSFRYHEQGAPGDYSLNDVSRQNSDFLDSCLREFDNRGTSISDFIRDKKDMEDIHDDPYGHRFAPPHPYYSGGSGGGGGYDGNMRGNTSFDRHSEHSIHSDRNRGVKNYSDIPNGAPYGSSNNVYRSDPQMRASPQPARSLTPVDYAPSSVDGGDGEGQGHYERESPYHNLPPYQDYYEDREDSYIPEDNENFNGADPRSSDYSQAPPHYTDDDMHAAYGQRDGSYAGSRGSFQGPPGSEPHLSGNYVDHYGDNSDLHQYPDTSLRYNGGVHYPEDTYGRKPDDYINQHYVEQHAGGQTIYSDQDEHGYHEDLEPPRPEDYREIHNRSKGPHEDPYSDSFHPQHPNSSFHDPRHDSYQGQYDPSSQHQQHDPYLDHDRYSDVPGERRSFDQPGGPAYHHNNSFHDNPNMQDRYVEDQQQRRFEGLPQVRQDPFADDPFHEQNSREMHRQEDLYYRGQSPTGGHEQPPYDDRGPPFDDRGPPYDDRGLGYDERDGPDPYGENAPRYPDDYQQDNTYYSERDASRHLEQLHLTAAEDGPRTPSIDGRNMSLREPDLQEVIDFLSSPDNSVKASAAAHLQHLVYKEDGLKAKTRSLDGIRPLIRLLGHELVEVHKNACGALQNLSYGKNNTENKKAIKNENGIPELIRLLRKTDQDDVKESVTGVLWNLSSCEDLKQSIIDDGLVVLVNYVILKCVSRSPVNPTTSELPWTTVNRNTTGILRNVSSAGFSARKRLRECDGLVNALISILKLAADNTATNDIDNKVVENTVCILRNLSYRIQEVVDPDFFKNRSLPRQQNQTGKGKSGKAGDSNAGCFGNKSAKAKAAQNSRPGNQPSSAPPQLPPASINYRALWGPEIHSLYSAVLKRCTNPITMEAAAGAIQNLTACDWQPAVESRAMVRKEKGLPLLVDLLSAESDRVVCATATALRNLAIDDKNKELVGKYAIRQLVSQLPRDNRSTQPDDTICAVIATLYEVVKDNQDFALALVQEDGLTRLMHINTSDGRYLARTLKFALTLLKTLWNYKALHQMYTKKYTAADFTTSKARPRLDGSKFQDLSKTPTTGSNHTTPYNTLSRPMSGQGYDDSTLTPARAQQRGYYSEQQAQNDFRNMSRSNMSLQDKDPHNYPRDVILLQDMTPNDISPGYAPLDEPRPHRTKPPVGGVPLFPNLTPAEPPSPMYGSDPQAMSEPLYAQVNKGSSQRRNDPYLGSSGGLHQSSGGVGGADSWV